MAVTVSGTSITFNDATVQSTAASVPTTAYAIGGYVIGRPLNLLNYAVNATVAGNSLYATSSGQGTADVGYGSAGWISLNVSVLINVGSWRCVSPSANPAGYTNTRQAGLWVRYA